MKKKNTVFFGIGLSILLASSFLAGSYLHTDIISSFASAEIKYKNRSPPSEIWIGNNLDNCGRCKL